MRLKAELTPARRPRWPARYTIVALFFLSTVLCYVDRVNISVGIIPLARQFGYGPARQGLILSAFFWGYLWPQLPGGLLADKFGGRRVLALGVAIWSLATLITPPAAAAFALLIAIRVVLGLGEAVNFPAIHSITARWTLAAEHSRVISLNFSGMYLGTVLAFLASPWIIIAIGWPALFYISGALGILWVIAWWIRAADRPEDSARVSESEMAELAAGRAPAALSECVPWRAIAREKAVWAIVLAHFCSNFGFNILLLWLPTYLDRTYSVPMRRLGALSLIPWVATFVVAIAGGWIADAMRARGVSVTAIRKTMQTLAFALGAVPLVLMPAAHSAGAAVALVTVSAAMSGLGLSGFGVNHLDVGPRYAGVLMGITNTVGAVPGIIGVAAAGFIWQATDSFTAVFYLIAAVYVLGMAGYLRWASGDRRL